MPDELIRALITIAFGALAGGLTNSVAIWMLFHPYEPPRVASRDLKMLQGAIPKNQPRLAAAVGRTVGTRLLTEEDLGEIFGDQEFRAAFDVHLSGYHVSPRFRFSGYPNLKADPSHPSPRYAHPSLLQCGAPPLRKRRRNPHLHRLPAIIPNLELQFHRLFRL